MKMALGIVGLALWTSGMAQTPQLGETKFVAAQANQVSWNRAGDFAVFAFQDKTGEYKSLGLFDCAKASGKTILEPAGELRIQLYEWLGGKPILLVDESEKVGGVQRRSLVAVDGRTMRPKTIWVYDFKPDEKVSLSWECSPTIPHAIVTVRASGVTRNLVVALGASDTVYATDIDKADTEGIGFAGWSPDGTAIYGHGAGGSIPILGELPIVGRLLAKDAGANESSKSQTTSFTTYLDAKASRLDTLSITFALKRRRPAYESGEPVWEVVPSNGVMRQIRFGGYFEEPKAAKPATVLAEKKDQLKFSRSTGGTTALWLAPNEKSPSEGVLISPQVELSWLHPQETGVMFTVNGTLFYRSVRG